MTDPNAHTQRVWIAPLLLLALLAAVSYIPPRSVGGIRLRRANIFSDLLRFDDAPQDAPAEASAPQTFDESEFAVDLERVAEQVAAPRPSVAPTHYLWQAGDECAAPAAAGDAAPRAEIIAPVEDFDTTGSGPLRALYRKWLDHHAPVRIAVLGDSFIEGDILTSDLRERLQEAFGGSGPGFAPVASPHTGFRRTVRTRWKGWTPYNIMQRRRTPPALASDYTVSGWVARPVAGATTRWEGTDARRGLDSCRRANIFFLSRTPSCVEITLNDSRSRTFRIEAGEQLRCISVVGPIRSLEMKVVEGADGFVGYGAQLCDDGVCVDNYSIRSNNGQALFWSNAALNAQLDRLAGGYDLVILQYGLNIMQQGVRNYSNYGAQIEKMVAYVRECFPSAAVLVMGVSDRSVRADDGSGFEPMDAAPGMTACQREAARRTGAAFWSTYDAMQALGGMARFVEQGWAGKDYTHINYAGGRQIAHALSDALCQGVRDLRREELERRRRCQRFEPVVTRQTEERIIRPALREIEIRL